MKQGRAQSIPKAQKSAPAAFRLRLSRDDCELEVSGVGKWMTFGIVLTLCVFGVLALWGYVVLSKVDWNVLIATLIFH